MTKTRTSYPVWLLAVTLLALAGLAFTAAPALACGGPVICVDKDAPEGGNGQTWGTAYKYLQDALNVANPGTEIWVAEGLYYPDEGGGRTAGDPAATFLLKSGVAIYGGFAATETLLTQRDWDTHITVLSGDLAGDDTTDAYGVVLDWENVVGTDNTYQIVTAGYYNWGSGMDVTVDATAVLDGFTITAGRDFRNASLQGIGAGVFTYKSNPTLRHLVFSGNQAKVGGGIYLWEGPAITMTDLTFTGNVATQGGGLYCRSIPLTLDQFLFQNNETRNLTAAVQSGGGMATTCSLTLAHGQFIGNTAASAGGLSTYGGPVSLSHVVFDSNRATEGNSGAGGMVSEAGNPVLTDVTFVNNSSNGWGGGYYHQNSALSLTRASFIGNVTTWSYGGGLAAVYAPTVITDAFFAGNVASGGWGSGMLLQGQSMTMTNAVFQGNGSDGLTLYNGATAALRNVTVAGNGSMGINLVNASNLQVSNSIIYGNGGGMSGGSGVSVTYSIVGGGCPGGATCDHVSNTDPLFVLPVVPSAVPTSTGNLRLQATSPGIDAGDNSAIPAGLTTDLDGNPRLVDTPAVADTGSGTPPLVDMGAYEYQGKPDLRIGKANNVNGVVSAGGSFNWTLTISNTGGDVATFANDTVILRDNLPTTGATYGPPSAQNIAGLSGTVNCTIASSTLTCTATGPVTLAGPGQFKVVVPVTPTGMITLTNPRAAGVCQVDPDNVISELVEDNNTCSSNSVSVGQATLGAEIHDAGHNAITSAPVGSTIHGQATVVSSASVTPTGVVTLTLHDNAACTGPAYATDIKTLVNGTAESSSMEARSFYYQVTYSGDSSYQPLTSPCTLFTAYQPGPSFTVNTTSDDTFDNRCSDIHCTLREAILAANGTTGANTILFDVGEGQTITLTSALPAINDASGELTINGQTYAVTVSGADQYRLFRVSNNARATLANLTLVHGNYTGDDCSFGSCGGGLKVEAGAAVTLTHSAILSSTATQGGGGIYNAGELTIQQSTLAGNSASEGGSILNDDGMLLVRQSTLAGNTALYGGGVLLVGGALTLENSTLSGNTATGTASNGGGGAINLINGTGVISNSTIVSNTAVSPNQAKSGIWLESGALSLHNSIVATNNGANNFQQSGGTFTSLGYNLANAWNGLTIQATDLTGDPKLGPLADNDGETLTHALLPDSPAIDAGDPDFCPATDQRGAPFGRRPQGVRCDIGAYEAAPELLITKSVTPTSSVPYHGVVTYTIVLSNASDVSAENLVLTDTLPSGVTFGQWLQQPGSGLVQTGSAITWTGAVAGNTALTLSFTAAHTGDYLDVITNTVFFSGGVQQGSAGATFSVTCPSTVTVQNAGDSGSGSLRQAIADICSGGTIDFAAGLAGQTIGLTSAELTIVKTVTITNPNAPGLQISGNNIRRVFYIQPTGVVTLSSLGVVGGAADSGGGIFNEGTLAIQASTFSDNTATDYGGAIVNYGQLTLDNGTFSGNTAAAGGGILNEGTLVVQASTFSGNTASLGGGIANVMTLHLRNSIIANSIGGGDCYGSLATNANNLIEGNGDACEITNGAGGSLVGLDPLLAPLADYGGSTQTLALLPGSPAINAGADCLTVDQRGIIRPQNGSCDIGAFESRGFNLAYGSGSGQSTLINTAFTHPLILTISSSAGEPVNGGQVIFTGPGSGAGLSSSPLTATISGGAASQVVTANNTAGSYVVTVITRGSLDSPAGYNLTNTVPDLVVLGGSPLTTIANGDASPSPEDGTSFGSAAVTGGQVSHTFTISNGGTANLTVSSISLSGDSADFSVTGIVTPATVIPGQATTFDVRFDPSLAGTRVATLTIASNDPDENPYQFAAGGEGVIPTVRFSQAAYQVGEDGLAVGAQISLTRTGQIDGPSQVQVGFIDDTATGGVDFTGTPITVSFPAGDAAPQTVIVPITQDAIAEMTEALTLTLASISNAVIGSPNVAGLEILDDDSRGVNVSQPAVTLAEGGATDSYTVSLTSQPTGGVTITVDGGTQVEVKQQGVGVFGPAADLTFTSATWATPQTVEVRAWDDTLVEGDHTGTLSHSAAGGDYAGLDVGSLTAAITDNDLAYHVSADQAGVTEGSGTNTPLSFTVRRTGAVTTTAGKVDFSLSGTATNGVDYTGPAGPVEFSAGESHRQISLEVVGDFQVEPAETITVTLAAPAPGSGTVMITGGPAGATITDDDQAGFIVGPTGLSLTEPDGTATFTLRLTSQPTATVTVGLVSADPGQCTVAPAAVTFGPAGWNQPHTITVTAVADGVVDGDQVCTIQTAPAASADPIYNGLAVEDISVTVLDNRPIYLPLILNNVTAEVTTVPDLVVESLVAGGGGVTVVVKNEGNGPATDAFWVDVYFNPNPAPPPLNRTWQSITPYGAHWGVTETVDPGETLTLTLGGPYYAGGSSSFPVGLPVYAYVDSINYATTYGNVRESREANNVLGPVISAGGAAASAVQAASPPAGLPGR